MASTPSRTTAHPLHVKRLGRVCELDAFLCETPEDLDVDGVVSGPVDREVGNLHVVHGLYIEGRISEAHEEATIEACVLTTLDDLLDQSGDPFQLLRRGIVGHAQCERGAPLVPTLEIMDPTPEQVRVGEHELLTGDRL